MNIAAIFLIIIVQVSSDESRTGEIVATILETDLATCNIYNNVLNQKPLNISMAIHVIDRLRERTVIDFSASDLSAGLISSSCEYGHVDSYLKMHYEF